jgi:hypothetical protein
MGEVVETQPTIGSNVEEVVHNNVHFVSEKRWNIQDCEWRNSLLILFVSFLLFFQERMGSRWSRIPSARLEYLFPWYARSHHCSGLNR